MPNDPSSPDRPLALARLRPGSSGWLVDVDGAARRLLDLGFVPGTRVRVIRVAPLGDPVEIELRGTRLCARRSELSGVMVRLEVP